MSIELEEYVFKNFINKLNPSEQKAYHEITLQRKMRRYDEKKRQRLLKMANWSPDNLDRTHEEIQAFFKNTTARVLREENIFINRCPFCQQLARTPLARQAKCGHAWRDFELLEVNGKLKWIAP